MVVETVAVIQPQFFHTSALCLRHLGDLYCLANKIKRAPQNLNSERTQRTPTTAVHSGFLNEVVICLTNQLHYRVSTVKSLLLCAVKVVFTQAC